MNACVGEWLISSLGGLGAVFYLRLMQWFSSKVCVFWWAESKLEVYCPFEATVDVE